ncbi:MAG: FAD-binding protein, partial [Clostridia bacterium]|nr:FAD-binding protein [Clostridia bacterium]
MKYKTKDLQLSIDDFHNKNHTQLVADFLKVKKDALSQVSVFKKSVDARRKNNVNYVVSFVFETKLNLSKNKNVAEMPQQIDFFENITQKNTDKKVLVVGSGSAGLFCALYLAKSGLKPILIEQGKS